MSWKHNAPAIRVLLLILAVAFLAAIATDVPAPAKTTTTTTVSMGDRGLNVDPRFRPVRAQPQDGSGSDQGAYLPPLAGPTTEIMGTVVGEQAGPTNYVVGTVTENGNTQYYRGSSDQRGHFHLRLPKLTGLTELLLFKKFDRQGHPDQGAVCHITGKAVHLENTQTVAGAPISGLAITEANTAYELGGFGQGLVQLHTRDTDALTSRVLLDGSDRGVDTLAASDSSLVGKLHDDVSLGRHRIGAKSHGKQTNEQATDVVTERFDPIGTLRTNQVSKVRLHIDGLGNDPARVKFTVSGAASLAKGGATTIEPVVGNTAQADIRAERPGELIIRTVLLVAIGEIVGNLPGGNPGKPGKVVIEMSPPPSETPFPYTTERPYGPGYRPPPCHPRADGYFEPSQGVWQDDPKFDDHPTKQITRPNRGVPHYNAELDMISFRDTLLFGVEHYRDENGGKVSAWYHSTIRMTVTTDCSDPPKGVFMRFTLERGTSTPGKILYSSEELGKVPITGHHVLPEKTYDLFLDSTLGLPPPPAPPFRIAAFGEYLIKDELYTADNEGTGLAMTVGGNVHGTHSIKVAYLAVDLLPADEEAMKALDDESEQLGIASGKYIPDYYPMAPHGIEGWALEPIDLSTTNIMNPTVERWDFPGVRPEDITLHARIERKERVSAELTRQLDALARLGGYDRFVVVMSKPDFVAIFGPKTVGLAESKKVVFIRSGEPYFTVAHELAHTLQYVWSSPQMNRDCSAPGDYHNQGVLWANGIRIDTGNEPGPRKRMDHAWTIMGAGDDNPENTWIAQCTYWNLANVLRKKPDPPAVLVRGIVSRKGGAPGAILWPFYDIDSELDLQNRPAHADEHWAIVYRDRAGNAVKSFPFEPQWNDENGRAQNVVPISFQLPRTSGVSRMELRGPGGFVLGRSLSPQSPVLHVSAPGPVRRSSGGTTVALGWTAAVAPGFRQLSTVLYSNDAGKSYHQRIFEQPETSAVIKIDPAAHKHRIKVIVTDGGRSTERVRDFTTP